MGMRGSEWARWDLHVHTPASLVQRYPGQDPWEDFLLDLEDLPEDFKVLGINDYLFLDGYRRILQERAKGRLKNIELVIPVIELRLAQFGGTDGHWSRVNMHVLFDPILTPEQIEAYFLVALKRHYKLSQQAIGEGLGWNGFPDVGSLEALGRRIIESVPAERRSEYRTPLIEGFNNLNLSLDVVQEALSHSALQGKFLTAVGKTEWADVKWKDGHIAEKKNIINSADFVFISAENPAAAVKARASLLAAGVNNRLLDCSDSHELSSGAGKDRIGNCVTWIKGDLTFRALQYARIEYGNRVFLGDVPPVLPRVSRAPGRFVDAIKIKPTANCPAESAWFNADLLLNPEMVCLIGNKGSGKSALVDVVGLICNSKTEAHFSFLTGERFRRRPRNPAKWFEAELSWRDGRAVQLNLADPVDTAKNEEVRYLPQSYLEAICNEVPSHVDSKLDLELKRIIFECLPVERRLALSNLDKLIEELSLEFQGAIKPIREQLSELNSEVIRWEQLELPAKMRSLVAAKAQVEGQLQSHDAMVPVPVPSPDADGPLGEEISTTTELLTVAKLNLQAIGAEEREARRAAGVLVEQLHVMRKIKARVNDLILQTSRVKQDISHELSSAGIDFDINSVLQLEVRPQPIELLLSSLTERAAAALRDIDPERPNSLTQQVKSAEEIVSNLSAQLSEPHRRYVQYLSQRAEWDAVRAQIVGSSVAEGSLEWINSQIALADIATEKLADLYVQRKGKVSRIAELMRDMTLNFRELYQPAERALSAATDPAAGGTVPIRFGVDLDARKFSDQFLDFIHLGMRSGFQGAEQADTLVRDLVRETSFLDPAKVGEFVEDVLRRTRESTEADGQSSRIDVTGILKGGRTVQQLYDFVSQIEYVTPAFHLLFEGKDIAILSPGQRGMVLLLFYLLVDPETIPLLVDQPEENLDNETVASYLTNAFRMARSRRQVIVVTHNANLAVVCDADQIIRCSRDESGNFSYESCSLESLAAIEPILNILEGTRLAFENREAKYRR